MLSIKKLSSASEAGKYYDKADYYTKGEKGVDVNSQWFGQGAKALGLTGKVEKDQFVNILEGHLPNGQSLARAAGDRVPGWDFTFSAPKSVSLLALIGNDQRLIDAHHEAVKATLAFAEKEHLVTRIQKDGEMHTVGTDKMLAGLFTHTTSRALDPQLHTHSVITNATQGPDGKWRTVESKPLFSNKMLLGQVYRAELAHKVQQLGFAINWDPQKGFFEIAGVDKQVIDHFSKRREAIKEYADKHDLTGGKQLADVALKTRTAKNNAKRENVIKQWDEQAESIGFDANKVVEQAQHQHQHQHQHQQNQTPSRDNTQSIVRFAYRNLSFNEAAFSRKDLINESLMFGKGRYMTTAITRAIDSLVNKQELILARLDTNDSTNLLAYTTPHAIETEQHNLQLMTFGINEMGSMARTADITRGIAHYNIANPDRQLQPEQADTVTTVLSAKDRVLGIQGYAGVGKSTALQVFREIAEQRGYQVKGFAPTGKAAQALQQASVIGTNTLDALLETLNNADKLPDYSASVWVVDETSMANSRHLNQLLNFSRKTNARVLLVGDSAQLSAVEQGKPFEQLQNDGIALQVMSNIQRQKNPRLKTAVLNAINGNTRQAFEQLKADPSKDTGVVTGINQSQMAEHYTTLIKETMAQGKSYDEAITRYVKLIIPDNDSRRDLNEQIRHTLQQEGLIQPDKLKTTAYINTGLKPEEKADPTFYKQDNIVRFLNDNPAIGATQNSYYRVDHIDKDEQHLHLINQSGQRIKWHPQTQGGRDAYGVTVYEPLNVNLSEGDYLRWRDKNEQAGLKNADLAKVTALKGKNITLQHQDGRQLTFNIDDERFKHFEYEYASTVYAAQGDTYQKVLVAMESFRKNLVNQKSFYVSLSRAATDVTVYTDNLEKLIKGIDGRSGSKTSALESIGHHYNAARSDNFVSNDTSVPHLTNLAEAAHDAIGELSEHEATFSRHELIKTIRQNVKGAYSVEMINQTIDHLTDNKALIPATLNDSHTTTIGAFTTEHAIMAEYDNLKTIKQGINQAGAMADKSSLNTMLTGPRFTHQPAHIKTTLNFVLTNPDRFSALVINDRERQITMTGHLNKAIEQRGFTARALTISSKQASHIQTQTGIPSHSIASFLFSVEKQPNTDRNGEVWLIDQSQMLGTFDMGRLLNVAKNTGARVIFSGDPKAIGAVSQGKPFQQLLDAGMRHHTINQSKSIPLAQQLGRLFENTSQVKDKNERLQDAINHYTGLSPQQRQNHLFWLPDAASRDKANQSIRKVLIKNKTLTGKQTPITTWQRLSINNKEAANPMRYKPGMTIKAYASHPATGIEKGRYYSITAASPGGINLGTQSGAIAVNNSQLQALSGGGLSVYQNKTLNIATGDKIRFKQNNRDLAITSGEILTVTAASNKTLQLTNSQGQALTLNPRELAHSHFDYAYTANHFDIAFGQYRSATAIIESQRKNLINQQTMATLLSHVKGPIKTFTDNQDKATQAILDRENHKQSALQSVGLDEKVRRFNQPAPQANPITDLTAKEAVNKAISHLYNNNALFKRSEILKTAITFSGLSHQAINSCIDAQLKTGELIQSTLTHDNLKHQAMITTRTAHRRETYMTDVFKHGKDERKAIAKPRHLSWITNNMALNDEQERAATHLLFSRDSVTALQGGLSDTMHHTLKAVSTVAQRKGYKVTAYTPRTEATTAFEEATGIPSKNVQSLLASLNNSKQKPNLKNDIWLVNEAGMMSTREMADLLTLARQTGARVILTGDTKQNTSVGQGMPFKLLLDNGLKSQPLQSVEGKSEIIQGAWQAASKGKAAKALDTLGDNIIEIKDENQRLNQIVTDYLKLTPQKRNEAMIVLPTNASRHKVNDLIRAGLKREGTISTTDTPVNTIKNAHLTKEKRGLAPFYQSGMFVRFNKDFIRLGIKQGAYLEVVASDKDKVQLKTDKGRTIDWHPSKIAGGTDRGVTVFTERTTDISKGDTIRFKENNKSLGRKTGDVGNISYIDKHKMTVTFADGKQQVLPLRDPNARQFSHAYAETYQSAQGAKSVDHIFGVIESYQKRQLNQKSFFTVLNKAKDSFVGYVDNKSLVREQLAKATGVKGNALDLGGGDQGRGFIGVGKSGGTLGQEKRAREPGFVKGLGARLFGGRDYVG